MTKPTNKKTKKPSQCETCVYYDVIDKEGTLGCTVDFDEDEAYRQSANRTYRCPYYKFYDEYKSVQRQN